jgi:hypothetical protein
MPELDVRRVGSMSTADDEPSVEVSRSSKVQEPSTEAVSESVRSSRSSLEAAAVMESSGQT